MRAQACQLKTRRKRTLKPPHPELGTRLLSSGTLPITHQHINSSQRFQLSPITPTPAPSVPPPLTVTSVHKNDPSPPRKHSSTTSSSCPSEPRLLGVVFREWLNGIRQAVRDNPEFYFVEAPLKLLGCIIFGVLLGRPLGKITSPISNSYSRPSDVLYTCDTQNSEPVKTFILNSHMQGKSAEEIFNLQIPETPGSFALTECVTWMDTCNARKATSHSPLESC